MSFKKIVDAFKEGFKEGQKLAREGQARRAKAQAAELMDKLDAQEKEMAELESIVKDGLAILREERAKGDALAQNLHRRIPTNKNKTPNFPLWIQERPEGEQ